MAHKMLENLRQKLLGRLDSLNKMRGQFQPSTQPAPAQAQTQAQAQAQPDGQTQAAKTECLAAESCLNETEQCPPYDNLKLLPEAQHGTKKGLLVEAFDMAQQFLSDIQSARALAPVLVPVSAPAPATACAQPRTNEAYLLDMGFQLL